MNMTTLQNLQEAIKGLNAPSVIDGETYESSFSFEMQEQNGNLYLFDANENYHIDYLEEQNSLIYEMSFEFGFKFEPKSEDEIHNKLEQAIKKDLGESAYLEWETPVRMLICYDKEEHKKVLTTKDFDLELAKKVADVDIHIGVLCAMEELEKIGFSISIYSAFLEQIDVEHNDYDELNLEARDLQYKVLGIYELMQQAYQLMEE